MRTFLAILKDCFREALDSKVFYVLLALSLLISVLCLSIGFRRVPYEEALEQIVKEQVWSTRDETEPGGKETRKAEGPGVDLEVKASGTKEGKGKAGPGRPPVLRPEFEAVETLGERFRVFLRLENAEDFFEEFPLDINPDDPLKGGGFAKEGMRTFEGVEGFKQFFGIVLLLNGYFPSKAESLGDDRYAFTVRPVGEDTAAGAQRMTLFFGATEVGLGSSSSRDVIVQIQILLANTIAGWIGVLIAIVVTSWFVPNMLKKGSVDLLLARPVPRWAVLVSRYLGGLIFVALNALFLVGGTWLGLAVGSGFSHPGYLLSILTVTLLFGIMYSVSVLVGVLFRNTVLCIIFPIGFWFFCMLVTTGKRAVDSPLVNAQWPVPSWLKGLATALYYVFPSTNDLGQLNGYFMTLGEENVGHLMVLRANWQNIDFTGSILSSIAFVAAVVALAAFIFHKKDY